MLRVTDKEELSTSWLNAMPDRALQIVRGHRLAPGAEIISLGNEIARPSFQDRLDLEQGVATCSSPVCVGRV